MARKSNLNIAKAITKQLNRQLAETVQNAAVEITNGLAEAGPAWSGAFSSAWDVVAPGQVGRGVRATGRVYTYTKRNFPLSRFEKSIELGRARFEIINSAPHASIALDLEEGIFQAIGEPIKPKIEEGFRPRSGDSEQDLHLRWQVGTGYTSEEPNASITAPKDWYITYAQGGGLQRDLAKGVSIRPSSDLPRF